MHPISGVVQLSISRHVMIAYDEESAVEYLAKPLPPYWRKNVASIGAMLNLAEASYASVTDACRDFDQQLMTVNLLDPLHWRWSRAQNSHCG